jgi:hypothetical protein
VDLLGRGWNGEPVPAAGLPALAAALLTGVDPDESLTLLRGRDVPPALCRRRERPLAAALACVAAALALAAGACIARTRHADALAAAARGRAAAAWRGAGEGGPPPALVAAALEDRARAWQAAAEKDPPAGGRSVLARWAAVAGTLPPDLPLTVTGLRAQGDELWVEGRVPSPQDARRLEAAWAALPALAADPLRITAGATGQVTFAARMTAR